MDKNNFLTPKAIANRIKAKGLQKLRWFCRMCQEQCCDENGFRCHCMCESHQRQVLLFGQNPTRIIDGYTEEFETTFLEQMKRSHRFSRVAATVVYNEFIADRNSTQWATLTEFVQHLGKTGKCKVEETPEGWFITYIDRDSETHLKERIMVETVEDEKMEKKIPRQNSEDNESKYGKRKRESEQSSENDMVLAELMKEEMERRNRKQDCWLCEGIIVKVSSRDFAGKWYNKEKGIVKKVTDEYFGELHMIGWSPLIDFNNYGFDLLMIGQSELQTVIPKIGRLVKIVNGAYRGEWARLLAVDAKKRCAKVRIEKGVYDGRVLDAIEYANICEVIAGRPEEIELTILEKIWLGGDEKKNESKYVYRKMFCEQSIESDSVLDQLMMEEEMRNWRSDWLCENIIVKVSSRDSAGKWYNKKKGIVKKVTDNHYAELHMLLRPRMKDSEVELLMIGQSELQTVIPKIGGLVKIVNGVYHGEFARLLAVDTKKRCAKVQIEKGVYDGRVLNAIKYAYICQVTQ